jgi:hypothetical protein
VPRSGQLQCGRANPAAQGEGLASTAGRSARTSIATAAASSPERSRIAKVLDALKVPASGYYDPPDPYRTVPRASSLPTPCASRATMPGTMLVLPG